MTGRPLITDAQNTWCPGCGNFSIQHTLKNVLADIEKEGQSLDNVVLVSGIGCHAKIADYLNTTKENDAFTQAFASWGTEMKVTYNDANILAASQAAQERLAAQEAQTAESSTEEPQAVPSQEGETQPIGN